MAVITDYWEWKGDASGAVGAANTLSNALDKMDRNFKKSAQAMGAMGGSMSRMGGELGRVASDLSDFGAMMLGGGIVGAGLAAATLAFKGIGEVIAIAEQEATALTRTFSSLADQLNRPLAARGEGLQKQLDDLEKSLSQIGMAKDQVDLSDAESNMFMLTDSVAALNVEIETLMRKNEALEKEKKGLWGAAYNPDREAQIEFELEANDKIINQLSAQAATNTNQLEIARQIVRTIEARADAIKRAADADARANAPAGTSPAMAASQMAVDMVIKNQDKIADYRAQKEKEIEDSHARHVSAMMDLDGIFRNQELAAMNEAAAQKEMARQEELAKQEQSYQSIMSIAGPAMQTFASATGQLMDDLINKTDGAGKKFAANMLRGIGTMLFGKGVADMTAAVASGLIYGNFTGVGPAAAEMALGATMMAGGSVLNKNISGGGGSGGMMRGGMTTMSRPETRGGGSITVNVSGAMTGAEAGRNVGIALKQAHSMGYL